MKDKPDKLNQELYAKREKVYPRQVHGIFATLRTTGVFVLLGLYYGLPWLRWGDRQAVLLDLPARQFHIFGLTFFPQDFFYLAILLIISAIALFFFTTLPSCCFWFPLLSARQHVIYICIFWGKFAIR